MWTMNIILQLWVMQQSFLIASADLYSMCASVAAESISIILMIHGSTAGTVETPVARYRLPRRTWGTTKSFAYTGQMNQWANGIETETKKRKRMKNWESDEERQRSLKWMKFSYFCRCWKLPSFSHCCSYFRHNSILRTPSFSLSFNNQPTVELTIWIIPCTPQYFGTPICADQRADILLYSRNIAVQAEYGHEQTRYIEITSKHNEDKDSTRPKRGGRLPPINQ